MMGTRLVLGVALAAASVGCGKKAADGGKNAGKPKIAVSIFPLYDVTRRIAGDRFDVVLVLPPGKSEHGYDATPKEIARLDGAKLGLAVGLDMDGWVEQIMTSAGGPRIVRIGDKVKTIPIDVEPIGEEEAHHEEEGHDDHGEKEKDGDHKDEKHGDHKDEKHGDHKDEKHGDHKDEHADHKDEAHKDEAHKDEAHEGDEHHHELGAPDPHFWMDPQRMPAVVDVIAAELITVDPEGKAAITAAADKLKADLAALDTAIAARAKTWTKRTIVTFHGSMQYYAKRYDIRIAAVVEPLAGKEPTPAYVAEVLGAIKRGGAAALFTEPQLDRAPGETIARDAGIPLGELDPVGGVPGRDTYEALLTWNTDQLEKVLK
jgi:zinc transport system substrate-binding protein